MSKATPGPWLIGKSLGNDGSLPIVDKHDRIALVDCQSEFKRGEGWKAECEIRTANASLIAAAPDMLADHQENARLLNLILHDLVGRVEAGKLAAINQCLQRSQAAIAKATGES